VPGTELRVWERLASSLLSDWRWIGLLGSYQSMLDVPFAVDNEAVLPSGLVLAKKERWPTNVIVSYFKLSSMQ
jgi:hypothetical protein